MSNQTNDTISETIDKFMAKREEKWKSYLSKGLITQEEYDVFMERQPEIKEKAINNLPEPYDQEGNSCVPA